MHFRSLNDTRNVFRLIFQNVADPIQEFPGNLDDGLCLAHPFAVLLEGHQKRRILTDGNPGGFDEQPSQLRMAPLRNTSDVFFLPTFLSVWNQSNVTGQLVQRRETRDLTQFRKQNHGCQRANPWDRLQQANKGPVLLGPGQAQDGPVQRGNQLAQMAQFLQVDLQGDIPAGSLHPNPLDPLDESSAPMAHLSFLRNPHSIKEKHPFDLVLAPRLLPHHALTGPNQAAILQLRSTRNVDPLDLPIAKTPGQFAAIDRVPFGSSLFMPTFHKWSHDGLLISGGHLHAELASDFVNLFPNAIPIRPDFSQEENRQSDCGFGFLRRNPSCAHLLKPGSLRDVSGTDKYAQPCVQFLCGQDDQCPCKYVGDCDQ